jgi:hypothetical protein
MFQIKKTTFFLLLLLGELILIETRFIDFDRSIIKERKSTKKIQIKISEMVKLFQVKLDRNELYYDDFLAFGCLVIELIKVRNRSLSVTPAVYWYSRKG